MLWVNETRDFKSYHNDHGYDGNTNNTSHAHGDDDSSNILSLPLVFVGVLVITAIIGSLIWLTYIYCLYIHRLEKCRIERQRLREQGVITGDDILFEHELFRATYRGARFNQINMMTGQVRANDNMENNSTMNYLLNNWNPCKSLSPGYENKCTICISPLFPHLAVVAGTDVVKPDAPTLDDELKNEELFDSTHSFNSNMYAKETAAVDMPSVQICAVDAGRQASAIKLNSFPDLVPKLEPVKLPCGHIFHECCIRNWAIYNDSCPNCRFKPTTYNDFDNPHDVIGVTPEYSHMVYCNSENTINCSSDVESSTHQ